MSTLTVDRPVVTPAPSLPDADPNTLMREAVRRALHWFETVGEDGWTQRAAARDADGQPLQYAHGYTTAKTFCGLGRICFELQRLGCDADVGRMMNVLNCTVYNLTGGGVHFHNDYRGFEPMKRALRTYLDATD